MADEIIRANDNDNNDGFFTTVDLTNEAGMYAVAAALNGAKALKDYVNKEVILKDVVFTKGVRTQSGTPCVNSYIILADGTALFSQSDGVARSLKTLCDLWKVVGFGDGITVKCVETSLEGGRTLKTIVPVKK